MDMMEFLRSRRTYRRFAQRAVAPEILTEAVDAARIASCGANRQTVRYCIVESPAAVAAVQPLVHWAAYLPREQGTPQPDEQPTAFIAILQDDRLPGANDVDIGLALGSLTAAAWAHGVGSCIMGAIDRPALTKLLGLPEGLRLLPEGKNCPCCRRLPVPVLDLARLAPGETRALSVRVVADQLPAENPLQVFLDCTADEEPCPGASLSLWLTDRSCSRKQAGCGMADALAQWSLAQLFGLSECEIALLLEYLQEHRETLLEVAAGNRCDD